MLPDVVSRQALHDRGEAFRSLLRHAVDGKSLLPRREAPDFDDQGRIEIGPEAPHDSLSRAPQHEARRSHSVTFRGPGHSTYGIERITPSKRAHDMIEADVSMC